MQGVRELRPLRLTDILVRFARNNHERPKAFSLVNPLYEARKQFLDLALCVQPLLKH